MNKEANTIKQSHLFSAIRLQRWFRKKIIYNITDFSDSLLKRCYKISVNYFVQNYEKFVGRTIQFILLRNNPTVQWINQYLFTKGKESIILNVTFTGILIMNSKKYIKIKFPGTIRYSNEYYITPNVDVNTYFNIKYIVKNSLMILT
tara:strand:+ start:99 stop:539 length:441 start_codon:yes stop_codon:yes gene_type:complete